MMHLYFHIAKIGCWKEVLAEQVRCILKSGFTGSINCFCVGDDKLPKLPEQFQVEYVGSISNFEFPTLKRLKEHATVKPNDLFCYIHTKGVSKPKHRNSFNAEWRKYMMFGVIENWETLAEKLDCHDAAGVEWYPDVLPGKYGCKQGNCHGFFAGNFWWSTGQHICTLPGIDSLDLENRWNAEAWIGLGQKPKVFEFRNMGCQYRDGMFPTGFNRHCYVDGNNCPNHTKIYVNAIQYRYCGMEKVYDLIKQKISGANEVYVYGVGQRYLNEFKQVKDPMEYNEYDIEVKI